MTLGQFLNISTERLQEVSPTPALDAQVLLMHFLGVDRTTLILDDARVLTARERAGAVALIDERLSGKPVAHLTGQREFWSLPLNVTSEVLIPRPETEQLVEDTVAQLKGGERIADLGTGSGAVAIAIAHERHDVTVVATDISEAALQVAKANASRLNIKNIIFRHGRWLNALGADQFHVIVSNPPYVDPNDPHLQQGDLRFEPRHALVAEDNGLADLYEIIDRAPICFLKNGLLMLEHGYQQGSLVRERLAERGYQDVVTKLDFAGLERVTQARVNH